MNSTGSRTMDPRQRTQNAGHWIEDQGARTGLRTADQGHWMKPSHGWPRTFIRWVIGILRCMRLAELVLWGEGSLLTSVPCVSLLLVLTSFGGFFSGCSGFPHFWKTNIYKFQFKLAFFLSKYHCWQVFTTTLHSLMYFNSAKLAVNICLQCIISFNTHCLFPGYNTCAPSATVSFELLFQIS